MNRIRSAIMSLILFPSLLSSCDGVNTSFESYDMSNVVFNDATYTYDGEEHSVEIGGVLPDGVTVTYINNNQINAGEYLVTAKFVGDKYHASIPEMTAKLKINKASIGGLSFIDCDYFYNGEKQYVKVEGQIPNGVEVTYINNGQMYPGTYNVIARFNDTTGNYFDLPDLTATMTISKMKLDNLSFVDCEVIYDGEAHSIFVNGDLPDDIEVLYENNEQINAGIYYVNAIFINHNERCYETPNNMTAKLTIKKAKYEYNENSIMEEILYDGYSHDLSVGNAPEDFNVTVNSKPINEGTYAITGHFENISGNYENFDATIGTLKIICTIDGLKYKKVENGVIICGYDKNMIKNDITIPKNLVFNGVTYPIICINNDVFSKCTSLENVFYGGTIEDWCNISFTNSYSNPMTYAQHFYMLNDENNWYEVTNIEIPTTVSVIGNYQFWNFNNIISVTLPNELTKIGERAFFGCNKIENVYYKGNIEQWCKITITSEDANPMRGGKHFYVHNGNNTWEEITKIFIPETIESIGNYQFFGFNNVREITIPDSVVYIGFGAFKSCTTLKSIKMSRRLIWIINEAFMFCNSLISIFIPKTVEKIGEAAFYGCDSLTIYCEVPSQPSTWGLDYEWNASGCPVIWGYNS